MTKSWMRPSSIIKQPLIQLLSATLTLLWPLTPHSSEYTQRRILTHVFWRDILKLSLPLTILPTDLFLLVGAKIKPQGSGHQSHQKMVHPRPGGIPVLVSVKVTPRVLGPLHWLGKETPQHSCSLAARTKPSRCGISPLFL